MGLVCAVHPDDELRPAAERLVAEMLAGSRAAQVGAKRLLREQALQDPGAALRREAARIREAAGSADGREGVRAFLERRPPEFTELAPAPNRGCA
jgi:2-(1,2-epoxy-1,2-dihydrophenyl)acetyl-CoA isomerase